MKVPLMDKSIYDLDNRIDGFYQADGKLRYAFYGYLAECVQTIAHGAKMDFYEAVAKRCRSNGERVSARTVRGWITSVESFTNAELTKYSILPARALSIACEIADQIQCKPQDILDWAVEKQADCPAIYAEWMPVEQTDNGDVVISFLSKAWRNREKLNGAARKRWERGLVMLNETWKRNA